MMVDLDPEEARFLSVLLAREIQADRDRGLGDRVAAQVEIREKLQTACRWEEEL